MQTQKESLIKHTSRANAAANQLANAKSELNVAKRRIAELEQSEAALTENLRFSQSEGRKLTEQISKLESMLMEEAAGAKHISSERDRMQDTINSLQGDLQKSQGKKEELLKELNAVKQDVSDLQILRRSEHSNLEGQLAEANERITQLVETSREEQIK